MIPKEAIGKAIEGGWQNEYKQVSYDLYVAEVWECAAFDPSFWQSLGNALGWDKQQITFHVPRQKIMRVSRNGVISYYRNAHTVIRPLRGRANLWKKNAHNFYELILTGGNTDAFWKELLDKSIRV